MKKEPTVGEFVEQLMAAGCLPKVAAKVCTELYSMAFSEGVRSAPKDAAAEKRRLWDRERKKALHRKKVESGGTQVEKDPVRRLWTEGLGLLRQLSVAESYARSNIGLWLKRGNAPDRILEVITQAHEKRIGEPVAWVTSGLNANGKANEQRRSLKTEFATSLGELGDFVERSRSEKPAVPKDEPH